MSDYNAEATEAAKQWLGWRWGKDVLLRRVGDGGALDRMRVVSVDLVETLDPRTWEKAKAPPVGWSAVLRCSNGKVALRINPAEDPLWVLDMDDWRTLQHIRRQLLESNWNMGVDWFFSVSTTLYSGPDRKSYTIVPSCKNSQEALILAMLASTRRGGDALPYCTIVEAEMTAPERDVAREPGRWAPAAEWMRYHQENGLPIVATVPAMLDGDISAPTTDPASLPNQVEP